MHINNDSFHNDENTLSGGIRLTISCPIGERMNLTRSASVTPRGMMNDDHTFVFDTFKFTSHTAFAKVGLVEAGRRVRITTVVDHDTIMARVKTMAKTASSSPAATPRRTC